ncbi:CDP-alcohol phosphatidyltransferase family protein, partial [Streptomyces triticirhizae]
MLTGPPDPGSSIEDELRALGFSVSVVRRPAELAEAVAAVPAGERVALVDPRFVGHRHSLRLALTDPRFATAAVPGALAAAPAGR